MKMTLPASHKVAMPNTPFGRFFSLFLDNRIRDEMVTNQNKDALCEILRKYSIEEDAFKVGEGENATYVKFKPKHVALTFGLPLRGKKVSELFRKFKFDPDQSSFLVNNNLQKCGEISKETMINRINILMNEEGSHSNFCRMVVLFMCATIFFPNSNYSIGKSFAAHLESLETMKSIGWTDLIYDALMKKIRNRKENWTPFSVTGCLIPLLKVDDIEGIVDVDELVLDDSKNVVDPTPLKNVRDNLHYNYLEKEEQTRLLKFFSLANTQTNAYEDDTCVVKRKALEDLMFDNFTDAEVINFYSKWLKKIEDIKCIYVSAYAWTHLKAGQHRSKEGLLDKVLKNEFTNDVKFVFFPINSSKSAFPHEGHHWSLLVLNGKTKKFQHYNSMRGRKGVDKYF
ncbi:hypothetical protein AQUCO_02100001v1 [Aquilegia coerulea]|uniref:Ubiquitin-like protease family profile domain-containing protein n=1 Tax=Aquilegia coerulea TaxID=218851 RepID=A0A2G5DEC7_AQUCA|nr:hypothetical protein AQUCO_02100001v1 [Aquilegia coerulea]